MLLSFLLCLVSFFSGLVLWHSGELCHCFILHISLELPFLHPSFDKSILDECNWLIADAQIEVDKNMRGRLFSLGKMYLAVLASWLDSGL